jgi:3',5'-cyclic AMP phosphodiesterase CpdA
MVMKKKLFHIGLWIACSILLNTGAYAQQDTLSFLQVTDAHMMFNLENYDPDIVHHREYTRNYKEANTRFNEFMATVPEKTGSDMVIATGDVIDFFDAKTVNGHTVANQVELFARFLEQYHHPFYMVLGNHETFSYRWGKDRVIPDQLKTGAARAAWIRNFDIFRDGTYYSRTFQVGGAKYRFIFLDNSFYRFTKDENVVPPYIDKPQLHWLKAELTASDDEQVIVLMHIPFTEKSVLPESNNELYQALTGVASVKLILSGHYHKNAVMHFPAKGGNEVIQVETSALVSSADNWRLIQLTEDQISVSFTGSPDDELVIPLR